MKYIQAHQMAKNAVGRRACTRARSMSGCDVLRQACGGLGDGDDEREVGQKNQRRGRTAPLVDGAGLHRSVEAHGLVRALDELVHAGTTAPRRSS